VASLVGSDIRDNPGAALIVHERAAPRIVHNVFARNGASERAAGPLVFMTAAGPRFSGNVFVGLRPEAFAKLDDAIRLAVPNENWFVPVSPRRTNRGAAPSRPQRNR
jgi:hypothetical protein